MRWISPTFLLQEIGDILLGLVDRLDGCRWSMVCKRGCCLLLRANLLLDGVDLGVDLRGRVGSCKVNGVGEVLTF